jgi:hypothetical protein
LHAALGECLISAKCLHGYAIGELAKRLGINIKSLYTWVAQFSKSPGVRLEVAGQSAETKRRKLGGSQILMEGKGPSLGKPIEEFGRNFAVATETTISYQSNSAFRNAEAEAKAHTPSKVYVLQSGKVYLSSV